VLLFYLFFFFFSRQREAREAFGKCFGKRKGSAKGSTKGSVREALPEAIPHAALEALPSRFQVFVMNLLILVPKTTGILWSTLFECLVYVVSEITQKKTRPKSC
jgi:hypothetical protein